MPRDAGIIHRPEPISDACQLVREPFVIVKSAMTDTVLRDARKTLETKPEDERSAR